MKRRIIQILVTITSNSYIQGFLKATIYQGKMKNVCVPGLNCYSCPGALGSCPIGSLQAVLGDNKKFFSFYVLGFLLGFGILFGRLVCGVLCPFGFLQDLIYKIKSKKIKIKDKIDRKLRNIKYFVLIVFVILLPMFLVNEFGITSPYFCKWICPAGTLEGGIPLVLGDENFRTLVGFLFGWKMLLLIAILTMSVFIYRFFCKYLCPLGAIYALFNKYSFYQLSINTDVCTRCRLCEKACLMNVKVIDEPNSKECIRCGDCKQACPHNAINLSFKNR